MKLKKGEPPRFELYAVEREAADVLIQKLATPPTLALPYRDGQYVIATAACDV